MLKKKAVRKILITTFSIITIFILCIMPSNLNEKSTFLNPNIDITYVGNTETTSIYLLGDNNLLIKTSIFIVSDNLEARIKEIINYLTVNNSEKNPNGLKSIIPSHSKLNNVEIKDGIASLDFNEELLNISEELEEKMIEAIVYSLIDIDGIEGVEIKINGIVLQQLPKTKKNIPSVLNRNFGINKVYDVDDIHDVQKVIVYYLNDINNDRYYVPVTRYLNDDREKIKIIIDNLTSSYIYDSSLLSLLESNVELLDYDLSDKTMTLNFNEGIFYNDKVLEEVIYSISESVFENYDVTSVVFQSNGENIKKIEK